MRRDQSVGLEPNNANTPSPESQVEQSVDTPRVSTSALRRFGDLYLQELVIAVVSLAMILFFLAYGFLFNLAFDRIFGLPLSAQGR